MTPTNNRTAVRLHPWQLRLVIIATWAFRGVMVVPSFIMLPVIAFMDWNMSTGEQRQFSYGYRMRYYASELCHWFRTGRFND